MSVPQIFLVTVFHEELTWTSPRSWVLFRLSVVLCAFGLQRDSRYAMYENALAGRPYSLNLSSHSGHRLVGSLGTPAGIISAICTTCSRRCLGYSMRVWWVEWGSGAWVAFATPKPKVSEDMDMTIAVMRFNRLPSVCPIYNPHPRRGDAGDVPCARRGRRTIRFSA